MHRMCMHMHIHMHRMKLLPLKLLCGKGHSGTRELSVAGGIGGWRVPIEHPKSHSASFSLHSGAEANSVSDPVA